MFVPTYAYRTLICLILLVMAPFSYSVAQEKVMTPELLWQLGRLGDATIATQTDEVAYSVRRYDIDKNSGKSTIFLIDLASGETRPIVENWASISSVQFGLLHGEEHLYFVGLQGGADSLSSEPQAFLYSRSDNTLTQVTHVKGGVANLKVSPNGQKIAFTVDVKLDPTVNDLYADLPLADARIIDGLMFRHWDSWHDFQYTHLHVADLTQFAVAINVVDLMPDMKADCPVPPFGGAEQFAWAPNGEELALTIKLVDDWAESTNSDVYTVSAGGGPLKNISAGNIGYDNDPVYSPDGKSLAFHSMQRAGFEADRNRIMVYDRDSGSITEATEGLDLTAHSGTWAPNSESIYFSSAFLGTDQIFSVAEGARGTTQITGGPFNWNLVGCFPDGQRLLVRKETMIRPAELAIVDLADGSEHVITQINDDAYDGLSVPQVEERWVEATDGKRIHCWVIYPPNFDPAKKWPMLLYCQGGPQSQIGQWFSYRWNFHLMASQGYVVLAPNRRGLPGFGQEWNDEISTDWGGQAMRDLLSATDDLSTESYIDADRRAVVGASFGGYTVFWMMGNHEDRFAAMIAHCGVFNLESMYGSTEELFFVNWDLGGPYWNSSETLARYQAFSPHRFIANWNTPLLVIHGERDFRVPVTQGMEAFTAAQVQRVPSRFLYFPDEGHWVTSPQNSILWQRVFFDWLDRYCKSAKTGD